MSTTVTEDIVWEMVASSVKKAITSRMFPVTNVPVIVPNVRVRPIALGAHVEDTVICARTYVEARASIVRISLNAQNAFQAATDLTASFTAR